MNCDESGRESTKNNKKLYKKRWAGVKGLKNSPKMLQNPLKQIKINFFQKFPKIKKSAYFLAYFSALRPCGWPCVPPGSSNKKTNISTNTVFAYLLMSRSLGFQFFEYLSGANFGAPLRPSSPPDSH